MKRYSLGLCGPERQVMWMFPDASGEYVTHADHVAREAALLARIEKLRSAVSGVASCHQLPGYIVEAMGKALRNDDAAPESGAGK